MLKAGLVFLLLLSALFSTSKIIAATTINVKSEGDASATVSVQNMVNSATTSNSTQNTSTKIRIESNGEVKEYNSTNGEDVEMQSSDGGSKVTVKGTGSTDLVTVTPKPTAGEDELPKDLEEYEIKEAQKNLFEKIKEAIEDFFKDLF